MRTLGFNGTIFKEPVQFIPSSLPERDFWNKSEFHDMHHTGG